VPWIIAMTSVIQDMDAVQSAFLPSLELFYQATGSKAAAASLQTYLTILYYSTLSFLLLFFPLLSTLQLVFPVNGLPVVE
jgi:hypothetical protein